ncbi:MAG: hypothetical protein VR67_13785 [Peptococcaceae bacterium BRH_c8a]|nr:MAG: hypothetical protein VR67_13785 [Peptococcaceae bacterium BRH_c8a]
MKKTGDLNSGISGIFWLSLSSFFNYALQLVIMMVLARQLSPSDFGEFAAITILIGIAELFWMMGVGKAIVQSQNISDLLIGTAFTLNIIFGLVILLLVNLFAGFLGTLFNITDVYMLRVFSFVFILHSVAEVSKSLSHKKLKFKRMSLIGIISLITFGVSSITFSLFGFGVWSLVFANIIMASTSMLLYISLEPIKFRIIICRNSAKELLFFGSGFTIASVFNYTANNGDYYVINKVSSKAALGEYQKAYQLLMYPVKLLGDTLDQVLFPLLSKYQNDKEKLKHVFICGNGCVAICSIPVTIVAFFQAEEMVNFLLGNQWTNVVYPFKILVIGLFFRIAYKLSDSLIRAMGKVYQWAIVQFIYATMVVTGAYLGSFYGLAGIAAGVNIAFSINYFMMLFLVKLQLGSLSKAMLSSLLPSLITGVITACMVIIYDKFIKIESSLLSLVCATAYTLIIYIIITKLFWNYIVPISLREFLINIYSNINKKLNIKWR